MSDFYAAFEAAHRGPRELIKARLGVYAPFFEPLKQLYPAGAVFDAGCGRGEWLELLRDEGFTVAGVDLDEGMLAACRERGLDVACQDAVAALRGLADESQVIVSAFHLVEHLTFDTVQELIRHALRVLRPGGLLILETPNSENIVVGTTSFYLDPTHLRPVPSELLEFASRYHGFERTKTLRLQESPHLTADAHTRLWDVFAGASPDYAVVAQKAGDSQQLALFDTAFERWFGLTVESLAERYEQRIGRRFDSVAARAEEIGRHLTHRLDCDASAVRSELDAVATYLSALDARSTALDARAQAAEERAAEWARQLYDIRNSTSWRLTAPLRYAVEGLKHGRLWVSRRLNRAVGIAIVQVNARPRMRRFLDQQLMRMPALRTWVIARAALARTEQAGEAGESGNPDAQWRVMGPRARRLYEELDAAMNGERAA